MSQLSEQLSQELIASKIHSFRGKKIMLDADLAGLYEVQTKYLIRQVKRNKERFPADFIFQLTANEFLRCQIVTSKGGRRYLPYAFTEQGVAMLSSVLRSRRAVSANITIMRTFVSLKRIGLTYAELKRRIDQLERKHDCNFKLVFDAIRQLITAEQKPKRKIGFQDNE